MPAPGAHWGLFVASRCRVSTCCQTRRPPDDCGCAHVPPLGRLAEETVERGPQESVLGVGQTETVRNASLAVLYFLLSPAPVRLRQTRGDPASSRRAGTTPDKLDFASRRVAALRVNSGLGILAARVCGRKVQEPSGMQERPVQKTGLSCIGAIRLRPGAPGLRRTSWISPLGSLPPSPCGLRRTSRSLGTTAGKLDFAPFASLTPRRLRPSTRCARSGLRRELRDLASAARPRLPRPGFAGTRGGRACCCGRMGSWAFCHRSCRVGGRSLPFSAGWSAP